MRDILNIVIPMAGLGSRFAVAGYQDPKPLIPVRGKPMIQVVLENIAPSRPHRFIVVCQRAHIAAYGLDDMLKSMTDHVEIVAIDRLTEGQVCTVLEAAPWIDNDAPLMTANSDQFIDIDIDDYLESIDERQLDGAIMTMRSRDPKWSFAELSDAGHVIRTAEKNPISDNATVGIYNFRRGSDLVGAARRMINDDVRVNGEFYICPCYNYLVAEGRKVGIYDIGDEGQRMHGLGTPADLDAFLAKPVSQRLSA